MTIHYQNYKRFSAGQGFIGDLCRPISGQASSKRWRAVDCQACRDKIIDVEIISRDGDRARIERTDARGVYVLYSVHAPREGWIPWREIDENWAPLSVALKAVFGDE